MDTYLTANKRQPNQREVQERQINFLDSYHNKGKKTIYICMYINICVYK